MSTRTYRRYISLEAVKRDPVSIASEQTGQNTRLKDLIRKASHWIEEELDRWFYPVVATYYFDHPLDETVLDIVPWLLSIPTGGFTTDNDGTTLVEGTDFHLMQHIPSKRRNLYRAPYNRVIMDPNGDTTVLSWSDTPLKANAIEDGVWGWSDDTEDTGTTLSAAISSTTATTFTVASGTAIETGWMLLIDDEQMFVVSVSNSTITVKRAQGGTTAVTHDNSTAISRYVPPDDIETLAGIIVARLYHRGSTKWTDTVGSPDAGILYYRDLPAEAKAIIDRYKEAEQGLSARIHWDMLDR